MITVSLFCEYSCSTVSTHGVQWLLQTMCFEDLLQHSTVVPSLHSRWAVGNKPAPGGTPRPLTALLLQSGLQAGSHA